MRIPYILFSAIASASAANAQLSDIAARALTAQGNNLVYINEIRIDQPGGDSDEYVELLGLAGDVLDGLTYLVIGDGSGGSGVVEAAIDLAGQVIPSDSTLLIAESSFSLGTADYTTTLNFENSDNVTHLLVIGFTGAVGDDLDTDDDGTLDATPWLVALDAISLVESPGSGDQYYASSIFTPNGSAVDVGPDGNFVPGHVYRCNTSFQDVRIGTFSLSPFVDDTPGQLNATCLHSSSAFCDPGTANSISTSGGKMGLEGSPFLSSNDAVLVVEDIPDFFGVFVQATGAGSPVNSPLGGTFCINSGIQRLSIVAASANRATYSCDFTDAARPESAAIAGETLYYSFFHRDTLAPGGNWSNGIAITWAP
ncbi:MAG: hypothetical protein ACPGPE_07525 [Planctomycetota bacterium]